MAEKKASAAESMREKVAKAIYGETVRQASHYIDEIDFSADDMEDLFLRLIDESETAQVLIFFSYLDDRMRAILRANMAHMGSSAADERLFGLNGPLATFNTRTLMAFHLGWLSSSVKRMLDAIRKIRNEFGHNAFKVSFKDQVIIKQWNRIEIDLKGVLEDTIPEMRSFPAYSFDDLPAPRERLCKLALLADRTFKDLIVLPTATSFRVRPIDICKDFDNQPELIKRLQKASAAALIRSIQIEGTEVTSLDEF